VPPPPPEQFVAVLLETLTTTGITSGLLTAPGAETEMVPEFNPLHNPNVLKLALPELGTELICVLIVIQEADGVNEAEGTLLSLVRIVKFPLGLEPADPDTLMVPGIAFSVVPLVTLRLTVTCWVPLEVLTWKEPWYCPAVRPCGLTCTVAYPVGT